MKNIFTINVRDIFRYTIASFFISTAALADTSSMPSASNIWENASVEDLTEAISQTAIQIKKHAREAAVMRDTIEFAWNNPVFTSDAIITKRQKLKEAEAAFIQARIALQDEVNSLPEIQKLSLENKILLKKIEALQSNNTALLKLLRARRKAQPSND